MLSDAKRSARRVQAATRPHTLLCFMFLMQALHEHQAIRMKVCEKDGASMLLYCLSLSPLEHICRI